MNSMRNPLGSEKEKQQLPSKEIKRKCPESQDALIDSTRFFPLKITSIIPCNSESSISGLNEKMGSNTCAKVCLLIETFLKETSVLSVCYAAIQTTKLSDVLVINVVYVCYSF